MVHETLHLFGINHCQFFKCCMNGANSLEESDSQALQLCPVDLHKLHLVVGFDIIERYKKLYNFLNSLEGFEEEAKWIHDYLTALNNQPSKRKKYMMNNVTLNVAIRIEARVKASSKWQQCSSCIKLRITRTF